MWPLLTFVEPLFILLLFALLAPAAWAIHLLLHGSPVSGAALLIAWLSAFAALSLHLHRRRHVRLWVSLPSAAVMLLTCLFVFALQ